MLRQEQTFTKKISSVKVDPVEDWKKTQIDKLHRSLAEAEQKVGIAGDISPLLIRKLLKIEAICNALIQVLHTGRVLHRFFARTGPWEIFRVCIFNLRKSILYRVYCTYLLVKKLTILNSAKR